MKIICLPVSDERGLWSLVAEDFTAAPYFLLVDSATMAWRSVPNSAQRREDRGCNACAALEDTLVDLVIVARIDPDALRRVIRRRIPVHGGAGGTAADALAAFLGGRLPALHQMGQDG